MRFFSFLFCLSLYSQETNIRATLSRIDRLDAMHWQKAAAVNEAIRSEAEQNAFARLLNDKIAPLPYKQQTFLTRALARYSGTNPVVRDELLKLWRLPSDISYDLVEALAPAASHPIVKERLIQALGSSDSGYREVALHALRGQINATNEAQVVAAYCKRIGSLEVEHLAQYVHPGHPHLIRFFITLLSNSDIHVRRQAAEGLHPVVFEKRVRRALIKAVEQQGDSALARTALYSMRGYAWDPEVRVVLIQSLKNNDYYLRVVAIAELSAFAESSVEISKRLVEHLINYNQSDEVVDTRFTEGNRSNPLIRELLDSRGFHSSRAQECGMLAKVIYGLWRQRNLILPSLDEALAKNSIHTCGGVFEAAYSLGRYYEEDDGRIRRAISHSSPDVRRAALREISSISPRAKVLEQLPLRFKIETNPENRKLILEKLEGQLESDGVVALLVEAFRTDLDKEVRLKAFELLCERFPTSKTSPVREDLIFEALSSKEKEVADLALLTVSRAFEVPRIKARVYSLAANPNLGLRRPAMMILAAREPDKVAVIKP